MAQANSHDQDTDSPGHAAGGDPMPRGSVFWTWLGDATYQMPSWLASVIVHMGILILLAWLTLPPATVDRMINHLVVSTDDKGMDDLEGLEDQPLEKTDLQIVPEEVLNVENSVTADATSVTPAESAPAAAAPSVDLSEFGFTTAAPRSDPMAVVGGLGGDALAGRGDRRRGDLVAKAGGTPQSEAAVSAALEWLADHQFADGGWSFAHPLAPQCRGRCGNPCNSRFTSARNAATGMALLPFLGAGQTHQKGKYKKVVRAGLYFLTSRQDPQTGSLWESGGQMYSHGIASIALCEAYAMTHDRALAGPAQGVINFISFAQDPVGGGWRYNVREPGDTSVVGWQIMALKSGHLAYLVVPPATVKKASNFLDSVQSSSGANYGYLGPGEGPSTEATTAIGLLCRMYLGWKKTEPDLEHGVKWLSRRGPNRNLYYDYYATQVMRHWEGEPWKKWNAVMRDSLVDSQSRHGHEAGSWFITDEGNRMSRNNELAGRLYCTALATMILEVYYRHMPIYAKQSTQSGFSAE
ncbi:MAG TPA: hypothetical protein VJL29_04785 [Thermoguttaceae bacterium]|nr:hypothetical protein [Thermoguttaceae bacterium]